MMSAADRLLAVARGQLGYVEQGGPHGNDGNITQFWDWWDAITGDHDQGASWCGCFVSWCYDQAGLRLDSADRYGGPGFIYCPDAETHYRITGRSVDAAHAIPGDIILFHFPGEADEANHTGILESFNLDTVTCIEGNTSAGPGGSQANGGGVYRRTRPWSCVRAICHPSQLEQPAAPQEVPVATKTVTVTTDKDTGKGFAAVPGVYPDKAYSATAIVDPDGSIAKVGFNPIHAPDGTVVVNVDLGVPATLVAVNVGVVVGFNG